MESPTRTTTKSDRRRSSASSLDEVIAPPPIQHRRSDYLEGRSELLDSHYLETDGKAATANEILNDLRRSMSLDWSSPFPRSTTIHTSRTRELSSFGRRSSEIQTVGIDDALVPAPFELRHFDDQVLEERADEEVSPEDDRPDLTKLTVSKSVVRLYMPTYCHLVFFSILGTASRIGLTALSRYPGAPYEGVVWAQFAGCFIMGFLSQDDTFFRSMPSRNHRIQRPDRSGTQALNKKTLPLYIGLTTGYCGSVTSFSTWMVEAFESMANNVPGSVFPRKNAGYDIMALLAVLVLQFSVSMAALTLGAHVSLFITGLNERDAPDASEPYPAVEQQTQKREDTVPRLGPLRDRVLVALDRIILFLGPLLWVAALILSLPLLRPKHRTNIFYATLLSPPGAVLRYVLARHLNPIGMRRGFPLGTFAANIIASTLGGGMYAIRYSSGPSEEVCRVFGRGWAEGLCGCLSTVSTWVLEVKNLKLGHSWRYAFASIAVGLAAVVVTLGSVSWSRGLQGAQC